MTPSVSGYRRPVVREAARGRPSTIAKTTRVSPKNANSRQTRNMVAAAPWCVSKAARTIRSSLKNGPKGGHAVTTNIPVTKIAADRGVSAAMPLTSSIVRAPAARRILPELRNSAPLARLLPQT